MGKRGQAMVEYVVLLVVFTTAAVTGWQVLRPAVGKVYKNVAAHRAGIEGMMP
jgi:Flp pilus assembly pilin Flp